MGFYLKPEYHTRGSRPPCSCGPSPVPAQAHACTLAVAEPQTPTRAPRVVKKAPGIDNLLAMTVHGDGGTNTNYYFITDHLGTVHAVTDESGTIVEEVRYDAWGRILGIYDGDGQPLEESAIGNRFLFQGREYSWTIHAATGGAGFYHFRARTYDPVTGRFLSKDPAGIAFGLNQFAAFASNPVMFRDPFGLCEEEGDWEKIKRNWELYRQWVGSPEYLDHLRNSAAPWEGGSPLPPNQPYQGLLAGTKIGGFLERVGNMLFPEPSPNFTRGMVIPVAPGGIIAPNTNPFRGPVSQRVFIVNETGNVMPVQAGQALTGSASGMFLQVRNGSVTGPYSGMRLDGPHGHIPYNHAHVPGVGDHIPVR